VTLLVVSDIFGVTPALQALADTLKPTGHDVFIVDPYEGFIKNFADEALAYACFSQNVGVEGYAEHLSSVIDTLTQHPDSKIKAIIGFSVGGSALWKISDSSLIESVEQAYCFYAGQIRHYTDINPKIKSTIIFPESEPHFSVDLLETKIETLTEVSTIRCSYLHGFMNTHSRNFNETAYTHYTSWLCNKIINS